MPLNRLYTEGELAGILSDSAAETALVLTPFYDKVKAVQSQASHSRVVTTNIKEYLPAHLRAPFSAEGEEGHRIALQDGDL